MLSNFLRASNYSRIPHLKNGIVDEDVMMSVVMTANILFPQYQLSLIDCPKVSLDTQEDNIIWSRKTSRKDTFFSAWLFIEQNPIFNYQLTDNFKHFRRTHPNCLNVMFLHLLSISSCEGF